MIHVDARASECDRVGVHPVSPLNPGRLREPPDQNTQYPSCSDLARPIGQSGFQNWSLTSSQQRPFKTGGRLIRHAPYFILQLAESHLTQRLFGKILGRIELLAAYPT